MVRDRIGAATSAASPRAGEVRALNRARLTLAQWLPRRYAARVTSERSGVVTRAANAVTTPPAGRILQCLPNYGLLHLGQIRLIRGHCGSVAEGAQPRLRSNRASAQPDRKLRNDRNVAGPSSNTDPRVASHIGPTPAIQRRPQGLSVCRAYRYSSASTTRLVVIHRERPNGRSHLSTSAHRKGGDAVQDGPDRACWFRAKPISHRREPALPVIRHVQVVREWCPEIRADFRTWLATAPRWSETLTRERTP